MNAIEENRYTKRWAEFGQELPRPKAILAISAHWYIDRTAVTADAVPKTIHDFGGFPPALNEVEYPAPGDPALAERVAKILAPTAVALDHSWGLDHGTWSVFRHMYPAADIPIVQLSMDATKSAAAHYELGQRLAPLREEGVLIACNGNIVHNLRSIAWGREGVGYDWAVRFDAQVKDALMTAAHEKLIDYLGFGADAQRAVPSAEHYLPLLYAAGAAGKNAHVSFPVEGFEMGSISMLSVRFDC